MINFYEVLGISEQASADQIKTAYKNLAKIYHPDKNKGSKFHEEKFKSINEAYQVLSNPEKKYVYDSKLYYYKNPPRSNTTKTYNNQPNNYNPPKAQYQQKKSTPKPKPKKKIDPQELKTWYSVGIFFVIVFTLGYIFMYFMNRYAADIAYQEGLEYEKKRKYNAAHYKYAEAIQFNALHADAIYREALLRFQIHQNYQSASDILSSYIKENIENSERFYLLRAKCRLRLKEYDIALYDIDQCFNSKLFKEDSLLYFKAEALFLSDKFNEADEAYTNYFFSKNTKSWESLVKSAYCKLQNNKTEEAKKILTNITIQVPDYPLSYYYRAFVYLQENKKDSACTDFNKAEMLHYDVTKWKERFCY